MVFASEIRVISYAMQMISATTGLPTCTSKPETGATNVCLKSPTGTFFTVVLPLSPTHNHNRLLFNDKFTTQTSGGFVVYYVSPGKGKVTAFKPVRTLQLTPKGDHVSDYGI
jgi:hypothetical protein